MVTVKTFGVVGAGRMGSGIAQVGATAGLEVILVDTTETALGRGMEAIVTSLGRSREKGGVKAEDRNTLLGRIHTGLDLTRLAGADFVVEAAPEDEKVKFKIFGTLDQICPPGTILATNTSSIPIGRLAASTGRPDRIIGMHFLNPAPVMKLVEVIPGLDTSPETMETTWQLALLFGKTPVRAGDYPGFISNRILMPMINEAVTCLHEGVGTREDIDTVMRLGMNHPMGPLALADFIGLDTCLAILETLHAGLGDPRYRPCPLLRRLVEAGRLGRKSGRGFYEYA